MISVEEYKKYRSIVESPFVQATMAGDSPDEISKLGAECSAYYARLSGPLADIKDEIMNECLRLISPQEDGSKSRPVTAAEKTAEDMVNDKYGVSRRQIEYLMDALDKLSFACASRIKSFSKEGHY